MTLNSLYSIDGIWGHKRIFRKMIKTLQKNFLINLLIVDFINSGEEKIGISKACQQSLIDKNLRPA